MKPKYKLNVDYLKLCYRQPVEVFETIASTDGDIFYGDGYDLLIKERDAATIRAEVQILNNGEMMPLGKLLLNNGNTFSGKAFFEYTNWALYDKFSVVGNETHNYLPMFDYVADDLGLKYNNTTRVDLALDTNINVITRIRRNIRNCEGLDMFLCRRKVDDEDKKIEGYGEFYASTRRRLLRTPELIIRQAKEEGTRLKVYDKSRELAESRPDKADRYFTWLGDDWNRKKDHIYRVEVSIRNEDLRTIHAECRKKYNDELKDLPFPCEVLNDRWKWCYFLNGLESLIYFRDKQSGKMVSPF